MEDRPMIDNTLTLLIVLAEISLLVGAIILALILGHMLAASVREHIVRRDPRVIEFEFRTRS